MKEEKAMYKYKEKTRPAPKPEKHSTARQKFSDADRSAQFKFTDVKLHGKLVQCFSADPVIQLRMDAGFGNAWHIHERHMKYGTNTHTRIDFRDDDTAQTILARLQQVLQEYPGLNNRAGLNECIRWINRNYPN